MGSLQADENQIPIQVIGPREGQGRHRVQGASNTVNLQQGRVYRLVSEYDFHFRLSVPGDAAVVEDEIHPGMCPFFILTDPAHYSLHFLRYATNGWLWITEWDA